MEEKLKVDWYQALGVAAENECSAVIARVLAHIPTTEGDLRLNRIVAECARVGKVVSLQAIFDTICSHSYQELVQAAFNESLEHSQLKVLELVLFKYRMIESLLDYPEKGKSGMWEECHLILNLLKEVQLKHQSRYLTFKLGVLAVHGDLTGVEKLVRENKVNKTKIIDGLYYACSEFHLEVMKFLFGLLPFEVQKTECALAFGLERACRNLVPPEKVVRFFEWFEPTIRGLIKAVEAVFKSWEDGEICDDKTRLEILEILLKEITKRPEVSKRELTLLEWAVRKCRDNPFTFPLLLDLGYRVEPEREEFLCTSKKEREETLFRALMEFTEFPEDLVRQKICSLVRFQDV